MTSKLVCAIDGSKASNNAVKFAIALAKRLAVPLCFLTIERVSESAVANRRFWDTRLLAAAEEQDQRELAEARDEALRAELRGVTCVVANARQVDAAIISYAHEQGFEHIVVGHTGHTAVSRIGSVAYGVVEKATCAVTIVK